MSSSEYAQGSESGNAEVAVPVEKLQREATALTGPQGLSEAEVEERRKQYGFNEVPKVTKNKYKDLLMRYLQPIPILMMIAIVLSAAVQPPEWLSFGLLLVELNLLVFSAWRSELNTNDAMAALADGIAPQIDVKRSGKWQRLPTRELVPGDLFLLKGGVVVPADALVRGDEHEEPIKVDESSLTGEALLATKKPGDSALSGSVVKQGELEAQVTSIGAETMFGKSMALLGGAGSEEVPGRLQTLTKRLQIVILLCGIVVGLVIFLVLLFAPLPGTSFGDTVRMVFVIIVAGAPVTLPVVVATILAVGAKELAREKAVVTRLSAIEELAGMDVLCSDKTGTLTLNQLRLDEPWLAKSVESADELYFVAVLAARREGAEAIDQALFGSAPQHVVHKAENEMEVTKFVPFNPTDKKTLATVRARGNADGTVWYASKGSPDVINRLCHASNPERLAEVEAQMVEFAARGLRTLGVAKKGSEAGAQWEMVGLVSLFDPPRHDTGEVIKAANALFVDVKMITGDQQAIAIETCARLGLGTAIMGPEIWRGTSQLGETELSKIVEDVNGFAGVYPEHKYAVVEQLQKNKHVVGMTGDGVNDAPALKKAEVGIAVAGATEAAKGAADIILSEPGLGTIVIAIKRARKTFLRLNFYVVYRIWASAYNYVFFLLLSVALRFRFPSWGIVLVSLLKDIVILATSKDKVPVADKPQAWNMFRPTVVALVISLISVLGSVLFTFAALPQYGNWWSTFSMAPLSQPQVVMALFLQLVQSYCLTVLITRTKGFFLSYERRPSLWLAVPSIGMPVVFTFFAVYLPRTTLGSGPPAVGCGWGAAGVTWAYSILVLLVAESAKLISYYILEFEGNLRARREMARRKMQREIAADLLRDGGLKSLMDEHRPTNDVDEATRENERLELLSQIEGLKAHVDRLENDLSGVASLKAGMLQYIRGQLSAEDFATLLSTPSPSKPHAE